MLTLVSTHPSRTQNFPLCLVNRDCIHKCPALLFTPMLPQYSRTRTVSAWPRPRSPESKLFCKFPSWAPVSLRDLRLLPASRQGPFQVRTCHRDINILDKKLLIRSSIRQLVDYRLHNRSRDIQNITLQLVTIILSSRLGPQDGAERHRGLALLPRHDGAGQPGGRQARPGEADHGRGLVSQTSVMLSLSIRC